MSIPFHYIKPKRDYLSRFEKIGIGFFFLVEINVELFVHRPVYIAALVLLFIGLSFYNTIRFSYRNYLLWILFWAFVSAFSLIYSINRSYTITSVLTILSRGAAFYLLLCRIKTIDELFSLFKVFITTVTINFLYILTKVDFLSIGIDRIGARTIESDVSWNSNTIGMTLALASCAIIVLLYCNYFSGRRKKLAFIQLIVFSLFTFLSGSRMALLLLVGLPLTMYVFTSHIKDVFKRLVVIILIILVLVIVMMNIPWIYDVLGSRVERLFLSIIGKRVTDGSISSRKLLIKMGINWFLEKPLLGYGMYTFMELSSSFFAYAWYAHNNYIEILVGTGIIGFLSYYWYYFYILYKSIKQNSNLKPFILSIMLFLFVGEYGVVAFKDFIFQFLLVIATMLLEMDYKYANSN